MKDVERAVDRCTVTDQFSNIFKSFWIGALLELDKSTARAETSYLNTFVRFVAALEGQAETRVTIAEG